MLAFILAIAVGLASVFFFFSAFFAPKLHRKDDFLWSGVGFFYALVLWFCATRITGGVLLGQMAAVVLILTFTWQTVKLRAALANSEQIGESPDFSLLDWVGGGLTRKKAPVKTKPVSQAPVIQPETLASETVVVETSPETLPETSEVVVAVQEKTSEVVEAIADQTQAVVETVEEIIEETQVEKPPEKVSKILDKTSQTVTPKTKKPGFFSSLFAKKSATPKATIAKESSSNLIAELDSVEASEEEWDETEEIKVNQPEIVVESIAVEIQETLITEKAEDELDDLLEATEIETEAIVNFKNSNPDNSDVTENQEAEPEAAIVTSISGLSNMLETYDENIDEFEPYVDSQENSTVLESNPNKLDLPISEENTTQETSSPEVSAD